ncbi:two-component system response regulator [Cutibacterium acnes]|nr:two-component system response regulator [Cutibacterium acnes]
MIDKTPIRLVLADDQTLVRGALAALLGMEDDLEIVGTCGRGDEVVGLVQDTYADVCLLDIEMPGLDGITVAAELRDQAPWCRSSHRDDLRATGISAASHGRRCGWIPC